MYRDETFNLLPVGLDGVGEWNRGRDAVQIVPKLVAAKLRKANLIDADLYRADLRGADLTGANLIEADLRGANLNGADCTGANLIEADLYGANLIGANLSTANLAGTDLTGAVLCNSNLTRANLTGAELTGADLRKTNLTGANLTKANLTRADLRQSKLTRTDLSRAGCWSTLFADVNLSDVKGLDLIYHHGPSVVGIGTFLRSKGRIPERFLRGCGLSPWEVLSQQRYDPELTPAMAADLQYRIVAAWTKGRYMPNGCFVSYSSKDSFFVEQLRLSLLERGINVWLDRIDIVSGTIRDQIWTTIRNDHVVIVVLSERSLQSNWVEHELEMARRKEKQEGRAVLCPIAIDDSWKEKVFSNTASWDSSPHLWATLQQKFVVDFSEWEPDPFDRSFDVLLRALKLNYGPQSTSGQNEWGSESASFGLSSGWTKG